MVAQRTKAFQTSDRVASNFEIPIRSNVISTFLPPRKESPSLSKWKKTTPSYLPSKTPPTLSEGNRHCIPEDRSFGISRFPESRILRTIRQPNFG